jgi:hypothetical protein
MSYGSTTAWSRLGGNPKMDLLFELAQITFLVMIFAFVLKWMHSMRKALKPFKKKND